MFSIIAFEGIVGAGKTTIIGELRKAMANKPHPLIIDRFFYSTMWYDYKEGRNRTSEIRDFYNFIKQWDVKVVFLDATPELALSRDKPRNKWKNYSLEELKEMRAKFFDMLVEFPLPTMIIDASAPISEIVARIVKEI